MSPAAAAPATQQILDLVRKSEHQKVRVAVADIDGILRGKYLHKDKFFGAAEGGFGFCDVVFGWDCGDVAYEGNTFTGWHSGYPDALARIDLSTYRTVPWNQDVPFFLGEFVDSNGAPLYVCPRQLLKKMVAKGEAMGFDAKYGMEFEWFNFKETAQSWHSKGYMNPEPLTPGMFGYSIIRSTQNQDFFMALMDEMRKFGVPVEGLHTETGPGVYEAALLYSGAVEAADRAVLFKTGAKEIGQRFGIMPSFMAKWNASLPGCSGHVHQSLADRESGKNRFYDEKAPHKMSTEFKQFVAGQLALLPEVLAFFAPTINSYKRLVDGYWAPTKVTWGVENRTTALRVIPGSSKSTRLETRVPGADCNPYLAMAAALGAGLYGIERKLELKHAPIQGNGYAVTDAVKLPGSLQQAADKLAESKAAKEIFGEKFVRHFVETRYWEWKKYQEAVTQWELQRYFEII
ncbi:MAG TPA: glutamine synthetase family protein [Bdellovibrionota bacterium]|jgi:glutamine synthetase|nr:glutamine synthetase family protein [Bdellovibrionota bacterium]